jgi:hypothetical protein
VLSMMLEVNDAAEHVPFGDAGLPLSSVVTVKEPAFLTGSIAPVSLALVVSIFTVMVIAKVSEFKRLAASASSAAGALRGFLVESPFLSCVLVQPGQREGCGRDDGEGAAADGARCMGRVPPRVGEYADAGSEALLVEDLVRPWVASAGGLRAPGFCGWVVRGAAVGVSSPRRTPGRYPRDGGIQQIESACVLTGGPWAVDIDRHDRERQGGHSPERSL